jgi:hypothetical protein
MIVLGALRFIHNVQPTTQLLEGTSVFGYSMGGILARYALAFAEHWNISHYCTQYISLDAPHKGTALNNNFQDMLCDLEDWMDDNAYYISAGGQDEDQLDPYLNSLKTEAAKQLIRNNKFAENGGSGSYNEGSTTYLKLFAEINEEERDILNIQNVLINSNPIDPTAPMKPGFPYKQNNIKSIAYANGSLYPSGIHTNNAVADYNIHIHVEGDIINGLFTSSDNETALAEPYDCQPGSVLDDIGSNSMCHQHDGGWWGHFDFDLNQYYAPVLVPTRSSLYLKANSITGGNPIPQFNIDSFGSLSSLESSLLSHTYFDQLIYAPETPFLITETVTTDGGPIPHPYEFDHWNWRHGELGWKDYDYDDWVASNVAASDNWLDQIENRTVCTINGNVNYSDFSEITGTMYINGQVNKVFNIDSEGNYQIPYLYTRDAQIQLRFEKPGCFPSYRDVSINYNNAMLQDITATSVSMYAFNLDNIIVSNTGNGSFTSVKQAIDYIIGLIGDGNYNGEAITIKVMPGIYREMIDFSPLSGYDIPTLTLTGSNVNTLNLPQTGSDGNVIIDSGTLGMCIKIVGNGINNILIDNLELTNALSGIHVNMQNGSKLSVNNCTISNCSSPNIVGLGIYSNIPSTIIKCMITNNTGEDDGQGYTAGGAMYLVNNTSSSTIINDCTLSGNDAGNAAAIYMSGSGHFELTNNSLICNYSNNYQTPDQDKYAILVNNVGSANIENNLFLEEHYLNYIKVLTSGLNLNWVTIKNNSFDFVGKCVSIWGGSRVKVVNNIMDRSISGVQKVGQDNITQIRNNLLNTITPFESIACDPIQHTGCLFNEDANLDSNFTPIWNSTTMSNCIDTGYGDPDILDGTPPDIGAKRALEHAYWQYRFRADENDRSDTYHWVSYPVVNSLTEGKTAANLFFEELLGTHYNSNDVVVADVLQEILWKEEGSIPMQILWSGSGWTDNLYAHNVSSPQGYKIKLLPVDSSGLAPISVTLHHSGFITPENISFDISGTISHNNSSYENWIGYFGKDSAWPNEAFASIWDDITMIMAKSWCLYRDPSSGLSCLQGKMLTLNPGDMVIVKTQYDHEFHWNDATPTDPMKKDLPVVFTYVEKPDYTPVYVDLASIDISNLKEIGLILDGECKGAVVVTDSLEQICAYLDDGESLSSGAVELVFYYESKSQPQEMKRIIMKDNQLKTNYIAGDSNYPVYNITVTPDDLANTVVPVLALEQNYPNPFNPSTSIRYCLAKEDHVSLDVYNLKGQLVKNLYSGISDSGSHTVIWNGIDNSGSACSSGVYFYKLRTSSSTMVRKMLMLK